MGRAMETAAIARTKKLVKKRMVFVFDIDKVMKMTDALHLTCKGA